MPQSSATSEPDSPAVARPSLVIGFNAWLLQEPTLRGWNRYAVNLLAALAGQGARLVLYADRPVHPNHLARFPEGSFEVRLSPPLRYQLWEQRWLPGQCARDGVDVLHSPHHFGLPWLSPCPTVLTLHDAIEWAYRDPRITWRQHWKPGALAMRASAWVARTRASRIVTVSEYSKADLIRILKLDPARVAVIPEAADPRFHDPVTDDDRERARQRQRLTRPYLFYVGGLEGRKNVPFLVRAFAEAQLAGIELVLAGGGAAQRAELVALAESLGAGDRLRLLGWIEDDDLPALYAEALAFVYPSRYEGFGLQLCEAMAVGCPVLAARATCLPEVLGEGGDTFSLDDTEELVELLRRLAGDSTYRSNLIKCARTRSADFSWRRTAEQTMEVYRSVISANSRRSRQPMG